MRENRLKELWAEGRPALGGWLGIPSSSSAELMAHAGFDWLCIDMQHGSVDYQAALPMLGFALALALPALLYRRRRGMQR